MPKGTVAPGNVCPSGPVPIIGSTIVAGEMACAERICVQNIAAKANKDFRKMFDTGQVLIGPFRFAVRHCAIKDCRERLPLDIVFIFNSNASKGMTQVTGSKLFPKLQLSLIAESPLALLHLPSWPSKQRPGRN